MRNVALLNGQCVNYFPIIGTLHKNPFGYLKFFRLSQKNLGKYSDISNIELKRKKKTNKIFKMTKVAGWTL